MFKNMLRIFLKHFLWMTVDGHAVPQKKNNMALNETFWVKFPYFLNFGD